MKRKATITTLAVSESDAIRAAHLASEQPSTRPDSSAMPSMDLIISMLSWMIKDQKDPSPVMVGTMKVVPYGEEATISSSSLLSVIASRSFQKLPIGS